MLHNRRCKTADKIVAEMLAVEKLVLDRFVVETLVVGMFVVDILAIDNSAVDTFTKFALQISQNQDHRLIPQNNFVSVENAAVVFVALADWA